MTPYVQTECSPPTRRFSRVARDEMFVPARPGQALPNDPALPPGTWFRTIGELPFEDLPLGEGMVLSRKLEAGSRVFVDLRESTARVRGWGTVKRLPEPLGWHVEFPDGSAVGMPRAELRKHCWVAGLRILSKIRSSKGTRRVQSDRSRRA